jgi:ribosomal small subunit protein bTHX
VGASRLERTKRFSALGKTVTPSVKKCSQIYLCGLFSPDYFIGKMGKGDVKTKRGKIWRGSNGKSRLKARKLRAAKKAATPQA